MVQEAQGAPAVADGARQFVHGPIAKMKEAATRRWGRRFAFGRNWQAFLSTLNADGIRAAEDGLKRMLQVKTLSGLSFLDIGSGSGLSSLAAVRLGAGPVYSFDYDLDSVACTRELKGRLSPDADHWTIATGSVLDAEWLHSLGQWDVVYSWGVLHHSGDMWRAMENIAPLVKPDGLVFISIYNDQELWSNWWRAVKRLYNSSTIGKWLVCAAFIPGFVIRGVIKDLVLLKNPVRRYREYQTTWRGMSVLHDWIDWLGGYPFEVAKPETVFEFFAARGFVLERMRTCGGSLGCNEFVFRAGRGLRG